MEDGKKLDGCISKIPTRDITMNDVDRTVDLPDLEMMKLADAILAKEVSIKSNKIFEGHQREGISLPKWCRLRKRMRLIMNELMVEFWNKELLSKKKEYVDYSDIEWEDLASEKNLTDEVLRNIVTEVEADKGGLEWLDRRGYQLNPSQRDTDPTHTIYVYAVEKFAMVRVRGVSFEVGVNFSMEVATTLKDTLTSLLAVDRSSKPEVVVIFSYNTQGESLYVRAGHVSAINVRILREEENQDEDAYNPPRWALFAPVVFVCDSARTVNVLTFAANSQKQLGLVRSQDVVLVKRGAELQEVRHGSHPIVHMTICYPNAID